MTNIISETFPNVDDSFDLSDNKNQEIIKRESCFNRKFLWSNIIGFFIFHVITFYALVTFPYRERKWTIVYAYIMAHIACLGVTAGVHRLWSHRAYKAKWPLRVILLYFFYASGQKSVYNWVRDHRVHHKFTETDADPHDASRGFFFSHLGWFFVKKHPEVVRRGRQVDMSDILADPIVAFGDKHYLFFKIVCCFIIPIITPVYFWNETWYYSFLAANMCYAYSLHAIFSVNSFAHMWGSKPYDKSIAAVENKFVSHFAAGEGWHNYHHVFPYDYKAAELGNYGFNYTTGFIDMFAKIGWAYDLKQPSKELINAVREKRDVCHID